MVAIAHLIGSSVLPQTTGSLSIMSYNVLLPNSMDGWWTFKMYSPPLDDDHKHVATWDHRRSLLQQKIKLLDADVVCLQEVAPASFEEDFKFMEEELGYDGKELFRKGRFRPATFWRTSKCELASPAVHKDRTLLTAFRLVGQESPSWFVLNCHLQAGNEGKRRVRQIQEGTKAIITLANKLKEKNPAALAKAVVCGDFNGGSECGAIRFLEDGAVDENFMEDGKPVTSSKKVLPFATPFRDVMNSIEREAPATLVVPEFISQMVKGDGAYENPELSDDMVNRLRRIYEGLATHKSDDSPDRQMSVQDVEKWLVTINGKMGRGDEFRGAARHMGWTAPSECEGMSHEEIKKFISLPQDGILTLDGFIDIYLQELKRGKFWGIAHDLAVLGEALPNVGTFRARFDRIYCSTMVAPFAVLDTVSDKPCPNFESPSDHLPVAATLVPS